MRGACMFTRDNGNNKVVKVVYPLVFGVAIWILMSTIFATQGTHMEIDEFSFHFSNEVMDGASKFRLFHPDGSPASYSTALDLLEAQDSSFRQLLTNVLQEQHRVMPAYFWECPPVSSTTLTSVPFEFVILPADVLLSRRPDRKSFAEKFLEEKRLGEAAVAFPSLRGDAMLVAPVPREESQAETVSDRAYMHLAAFVDAADVHQVDALWSTVAQTMRKQLGTVPAGEKIWLSTSGAGVQWLHVRLDSRPKYYNWHEYM